MIASWPICWPTLIRGRLENSKLATYMKIDFTALKTEERWKVAWVDFLDSVTEEIFRLLEWCLIVAGLFVMQHKTGSKLLHYVNSALLILVLIYLFKFFPVQAQD